MAYQPTPDEIRALIQAANGPINTLLTKWKDTATTTALKATEPADIYRMQGRVAVIEELQDLMRKAPQLAQR
jgi:hypothetical protein